MKTTTFGEISKKIFSGGTPSTMEPGYWDGPLPWLSSGETGQTLIFGTVDHITPLGVENSSTKLAKKGSIVIASAGQGNTRGQVSFLEIDTYVNQSVIVLEIDEAKAFPYFVFLNLRMRYKELRSVSDENSIRGSITIPIISGLPLSLPDMTEQIRIGNFVHSLDLLSKNLDDQAFSVYSMAKEYYQDRFVRFHSPKLELNDFDCGIPKGWSYRSLSDFCSVDYGFPFDSAKFTVQKTAYPVVRIRDILDCSSSTFTSEDPGVFYKLSENDILVGMDGNFHMNIWGEDLGYLNQRVTRLRVKTGIPLFYVYFSVLPQIEDLESVIQGTTVAHLGAKDWADMRILWPGTAFLNEAGEILQPLLLKWQSLRVRKKLVDNEISLTLPYFLTPSVLF